MYLLAAGNEKAPALRGGYPDSAGARVPAAHAGISTGCTPPFQERAGAVNPCRALMEVLPDAKEKE